MPSVVRLPCVLFALERERLFLHHAYCIDQAIAGAPCPAFLCSCDKRRIVVVETGVGAAAAVGAVNWLLRRPTLPDAVCEPDLLLFAGFAGALHESLHVGDVILAQDVVDLDGRMWLAPLRPAPLPRVLTGRVLTTARFIGEPAEKLALGVRHSALAVDMESAAFAQRCTERGVPWSCLRVISDDVSEPFTTEVAGLVEGGRVHMGRVFWLLLRQPWKLTKLLRLGRQTRHAAQRLADAVIQFLACSSAG
jgi:adenosylhomocysteine nucleosidase